ncbi:MAG: Gfo/Idh/MocA family oxidoreductase [Opitutaceae bacterium]|jgi:predicted dehydrogenase|nr:Gfo/Idh/MocA family oxidoreductase [Opitutaceae bacterium]
MNRRNFLGNCAALSAIPLLSSLPASVFAAGSDRLKIGLVGCGGRGTGAVRDCIAADPSVQLWAMGDIFPDCLAATQEIFTKGRQGNRPVKPLAEGRYAVTPERSFTGFDAYQGVINSGIDLVILATPPGFRPLHMEAAINKGVHVFAEKPVAVDPVGAKRVIAVGELAKQKRLGIGTGTQRRHTNSFQAVMQRVQDGAIGELTGGQCYWLGGALWHRGRKPEWTEMEYQIRNWYYFNWLCGDHIVEQHIHNIDVINWAFGGPPVKALGMGGRQWRTDPIYGEIWDHFSIEFEYANGARVASYCRHTKGAASREGERVTGTLGNAEPKRGSITGKNAWTFEGERNQGMVQEHVDLIASIRAGNPINDARRIAESTLTAILGRMSAYTGREINYDWMLNASKLDLTPPAYQFGDAPPVNIAVPGVTPLV